MFRSWPVHGSDEVLQVLFLFEIYVFCENKSHAIKFILRKTLKNVIDLFSSKSKKKKKDLEILCKKIHKFRNYYEMIALWFFHKSFECF